MSTRDSFVAAFGEDAAVAIENAAEEHKNGIHDRQGSDPFKWAVLICIGFECVSKPDYAAYHGIAIEQAAFKAWCLEHGDLGSHDGDIDYLSAFCGAYNEYMPMETQP